MRKLVWAAAAVLAGVTACGQSNDHPTNLHFDGGTGLTGGGGGGGGGGMAGGGGAAGSVPCDQDAQAGHFVGGNLIVYDATVSESNKQPYAGKARITMQGAICDWVETTWDAASPLNDAGKNYFQLDNVKGDPTSPWAHIYQQAGGNEAVYPTLIPVQIFDTIYDDGFGFVSSTEVDKAYQAVGVTRDPNKATLLVQLLQLPGQVPLAGGSASSTLPGDGVAYASAGGWSATGPTDDTGVVLLLNIDGGPFPGKTTAVHAVSAGQPTDYDCVVEGGAVTICWVAIGF